MSGLRTRARRFVESRMGGTVVVLLYHRVATLERDPQLLAVTPENFDAQLAMLSQRYRPISLAALLEGLRKRSLPKHAIVLTFDDGYSDNLLAAKPAMRRYRVPATVFVSSGHLDAAEEYWWDEVERLTLAPDTLPAAVRIELPAAVFERRLDEGADLGSPDVESARAWNVTLPPENARQQLYADLCAFIRPLAPDDRATALSQLRSAVGADAVVRASHRPLSAAETAGLDAAAFVDVGGHTTHHPVLSALPAEDQRREIFEDREALARVCGREIATFSYPYGSLDDYTDETVALVREAGYAGACSNHPGLVKPWTDGFRIPRHLVRDWDAEALAAKIDGWFEGLT